MKLGTENQNMAFRIIADSILDQHKERMDPKYLLDQEQCAFEINLAIARLNHLRSTAYSLGFRQVGNEIGSMAERWLISGVLPESLTNSGVLIQ